jgi:hypothetical protein
MRLPQRRSNPYPEAGRVRFYLICYEGVRVIEADAESLASGKERDSELFIEGQRVIRELRLTVQKQKGEPPD